MVKDIFPSAEEIKDAVRQALQKFYLNDIYLIHADVHERSLTFRLGMYLQELFPSWNVDCEYNKNIETIRMNKLLGTRCQDFPEMRCRKCGQQRSCTVFPDIIIHRRGTSQNLLVIEAKKDAKASEKDADIQKIDAYLWEFSLKYRCGLFLDFKESLSETIENLIWFPSKDTKNENRQETGSDGI